MRQNGESIRQRRRSALRRAAVVTAATLFATARALAQDKQAASTPRASEAAAPSVRRVIVSIPDRKLALTQDGHVVKIYRIAVGAKDAPSPAGSFRIVHRIPEPTYYAPGIVTPPGPENPLGTRWIGLSAKGFGIHGTNQPGSIGRRASHGCIRMRNRDVEDLFERIHMGDAVELIAERTEEVAQILGGPAAAPRILTARAIAPQAAEAEEATAE